MLTSLSLLVFLSVKELQSHSKCSGKALPLLVLQSSGETQDFEYTENIRLCYISQLHIFKNQSCSLPFILNNTVLRNAVK